MALISSDSDQQQVILTQMSELVLHGYTVEQLAQHFKRNRDWVTRHIAVLRAEWQEHRLRTAEEHFDEALAKLDELERVLWDDVLGKNGKPNLRSAERLLVLFDQRNKLKGLYAPTKSELDIGEQLTKLLSRISEEPEEVPALPAPQISVEGESRDLNPTPEGNTPAV